jgi:hypothetical protein
MGIIKDLEEPPPAIAVVAGIAEYMVFLFLVDFIKD